MRVDVQAAAVRVELVEGVLELPPGGFDELVGEDRLGGELLGEDVFVDVGGLRPDWVLLDAHDLEQTQICSADARWRRREEGDRHTKNSGFFRWEL